MDLPIPTIAPPASPKPPPIAPLASVSPASPAPNNLSAIEKLCFLLGGLVKSLSLASLYPLLPLWAF